MPHLSPAIKSGSFLFLSGQLAFDSNGKIQGDVEEQTALILAHQFKVLAEYNLGPENVVKAGVNLMPHLPAHLVTICQLVLPLSHNWLLKMLWLK